MAPKKGNDPKGKKRGRYGEIGQGSGTNLEPNWNIHRSNKYLFRDIRAYENFTGLFMHRKLTDCYYFDKASVRIRQPEGDKIIDYLNHWYWNPLVSCCEPYTEILTRTFYANLTIVEEPYLVASWVCGQEIRLTLESVAAWLELPNNGEETYPLE